MTRLSLPRPVASDFEQAGITSALERLARSSSLPDALPRWLWDAEGGTHAAIERVRTGAQADVVALLEMLESLPLDQADRPGEMPVSVSVEAPARTARAPAGVRARWTDEEATLVVATLRMRVGLALEAVARNDWGRAGGSGAPASARTRQRSRRRPLSAEAFMMFDAYAAAVWTSAHAEYLSDASSDTCVSSPPSIHSVLSQATEPNISNLLDTRGFAQSSTAAAGRTAHPMHQLLMRCVNPASRGWRTSLTSIIERHAGPRFVIGCALVVCLSAMHPCLEPSNRPGWRTRLVASRRAKAALLGEASSETIVCSPDAAKEATRRLLGGLLADSLAARNVAVRLGSPLTRLASPPHDSPARGMLVSMARLAAAGSLCGEASAAALPATSVAAALLGACGGVGATGADDLDEHEHDHHGQARPTEPSAEPASRVAWIGRSKQRPALQSLLDRAVDCFANSFKAEYLPFWMRSTSCGARPQRLDVSQHEAIHEQSAALELCRAMPIGHALRAQRAALVNPSAPLLDAPSAARLLGLAGADADTSYDAPIETLPTRGAAMLLQFARVAWICEQLLVVDLGPRTRTLQLTAMAWRHLNFAPDEPSALLDDARKRTIEHAVAGLPVHITHLCVCTACTRVANCTASKASPAGVEFCEMGVSSVTVQRDLDTYQSQLYCAKRSSAALRSSVAFETAARRRCVEFDVLMSIGCTTDGADVVGDAMSAMAHDGTVASRMRRDCKRALEQRRSARQCDDCEMLTVPIIGRAVRVYGVWYALCSFCACCVRLEPQLRIEAEIACLRCCSERRRRRSSDASGSKDAPVRAACRFCRKLEGLRQSPFTKYHSPHDVSDGNLARPPARRITAWCPKHDRSWIASALKELTTAQILAHITHRAPPCAGLDENSELDPERRPSATLTASQRRVLRRGGGARRKKPY